MKTAPAVEGISPEKYAQKMGKGMDVDWAKTGKGRSNYNSKTVRDFKQKGLSHVRIRIKDEANAELLRDLDAILDDCLRENLIPVVAFQGEKFKNDPSDKNLDWVVNWWKIVGEHLKKRPNEVSFDLLIEVTDALNKEPERLNVLYEKAVAEIRKTNPKRILFISPRLRSDPEFLNELKIPSRADGFLMAEWHFYASGPSKTNPKKLWTTGTEAEKKLIRNKIKFALDWQQKTGLKTWVGAWMPGNYNEGDDYTVPEQIAFSRFVACELDKAGIPFAVNSDVKFYDRESGEWVKKMSPVLDAILFPGDCK